MADQAPDPRFTYQDISSTGLTVKRLDELMSFVMAGGVAGIPGAIISGLKLIVAAGYVYARERVANAEAQFEKQKYQQNQGQGSQGQIDGDELGSEPRKP